MASAATLLGLVDGNVSVIGLEVPVRLRLEKRAHVARVAKERGPEQRRLPRAVLEVDLRACLE